MVTMAGELISGCTGLGGAAVVAEGGEHGVGSDDDAADTVLELGVSNITDQVVAGDGGDGGEE